jgi:toxin ParE1/3/4
MKRFRFHPEAQVEMVESAKYYEAEQEELGKRFLEAVRTAARRVCLSPAIYQRVQDDIRQCSVDRFPFGIVFREERDHIQIIAVVHFRRDPDYWKRRI